MPVIALSQERFLGGKTQEHRIPFNRDPVTRADIPDREYAVPPLGEFSPILLRVPHKYRRKCPSHAVSVGPGTIKPLGCAEGFRKLLVEVVNREV